MRGFWIGWMCVGLCAVIVGCGQTTAPPKERGDFDSGGGDPNGGQQSPCEGGVASELTAQEMNRAAEANQTEFSVTFTTLECIEVPTVLEFRVSMTNHSCSIPGYDLDLDEHSRIVTSDGVTVSDGFSYEVLSADDHHPLGVLSASSHHQQQPLIGCLTESVSLEVFGIDQSATETVVFTWEGSVLDGVRDCP